MEEKPAILVVSAHDELTTSIRNILEEHYETVTASDPGHAIQVATARAFNAFLIDADSLAPFVADLCRGVRGLSEHETTPVIVMLGADAYESLDLAFAAGCNDFIHTPLDALELKARLRGHLTRLNSAQQLERRRRMLNRYLSRRTLEIVDAVARMGVVPPPEERNLSVLFTDMRGFTALAEDSSPQALFDLVSSTLAAQVARVHQFGGYVDKFGGDGLMAIFDGPDMVVQSCLCALEITKHADLESRAGIGIHIGRAIIGNIGSPEHLDYSAIGATVNIAARLCGEAAANTIVVSEAVRDAAMDKETRLRFHSGRLASIKGMRAPLKIYTLSDATTE